MKKIFFWVACVAALFFAACKKVEPNKVLPVCSNNAMVHYTARPIPDLCQLWLTVDSTTYLPLNLDTAFLVDSLKVSLCYTLSGDSETCGFISFHYQEINIVSIQRR